jgi:hypothetical protein
MKDCRLDRRMCQVAGATGVVPAVGRVHSMWPISVCRNGGSLRSCSAILGNEGDVSDGR